jgi:hypothetical protein
LIDVLHPPLWLVALLAAGAAPFLAGAMQALLESKLRRRTEMVLARAFSTPGETVDNRRAPNGAALADAPRVDRNRRGPKL